MFCVIVGLTFLTMLVVIFLTIDDESSVLVSQDLCLALLRNLFLSMQRDAAIILLKLANMFRKGNLLFVRNIFPCVMMVNVLIFLRKNVPFRKNSSWFKN